MKQYCYIRFLVENFSSEMEFIKKRYHKTMHPGDKKRLDSRFMILKILIAVFKKNYRLFAHDYHQLSELRRQKIKEELINFLTKNGMMQSALNLPIQIAKTESNKTKKSLGSTKVNELEDKSKFIDGLNWLVQFLYECRNYIPPENRIEEHPLLASQLKPKPTLDMVYQYNGRKSSLKVVS